MSIQAILFITGLILIKFCVQTYLIVRQKAALKKGRSMVPSAFQSLFQLSEHQKAVDYAQAKLNFSLTSSFMQSLILFLWFYTGAVQELDSILSATITHPIWQALALIGVVSFAESFVMLPWSLYNQFHLEEKFGFNRTTLKTFIIDRLKGVLLMVIIATALGYPLISLMLHFKFYWFVPAFFLYASFQFLLSWLFPTLIAPLFNKFSPLQDLSLAHRIDDLVKEAGFNSQGVFVMDASKRSGHGNAYFTGLGKNKRIVFFDTLLEKLSPDQTLAVLAHEIGHLSHGHIKKGLFVSFFMTSIGFAVMGWYSTQEQLITQLGLPFSYGAVLISGMWLIGLITFPLTPLINRWSRKHEFEADQYAVKRTSSENLGTALIELYRSNSGSVIVDPIYAAWTYSHPPLPVRLEAMGHQIQVKSE
jgi:STE24 endopeptidase